jgi:protocatechuate 4,5-dioxygenase alpha chain
MATSVEPACLAANNELSSTMGLERDYHDIPGSYVQDGAHYRAGFRLNMFCMSLSDACNRDAFKSDEATYLGRFKLTQAQRNAVLNREWLELLRLGGNIFYTVKLAMLEAIRLHLPSPALGGKRNCI